MSFNKMESSHVYIYAVHFFLFMPLLIYIGIRGPQTPPAFFQILIGIGILGMLYHGFKLYILWKKNKNITIK